MREIVKNIKRKLSAASISTWIVFVLHSAAFISIMVASYPVMGFSWLALIVSVFFPIWALFKNINDYDLKKKAITKRI